MSHQTGIRANDELKALFSTCKSSESIRIIKIVINDEQLTLHSKYPSVKTWEQDFQSSVNHAVEDGQACYMLVRQDSRNSLGFDWILIAYTPDNAPVRHRMVYAATRATLKSEFGPAYVKQDIHASSKHDLSLEHIKNNSKLPAVLSFVEGNLLQAKLEENNPESYRRLISNQTLKGVAFPIDQEALEKLSLMRQGDVNYVQLSIDTLNEAIKLECCEKVEPNRFHSFVPKHKARYHFYQFEHTYDGRQYKSVVFIYTIPPSYNYSIKEKMLYSSCKASLIDMVEKEVKLKIDKKIEIDSSEELNEAFLVSELHPESMKALDNQNQQQISSGFAKPMGPKNQRGVRRITKDQ